MSPHCSRHCPGGVPAQRVPLVGQREDEGDDEQDHGNRGPIPNWVRSAPLKYRYVSIVCDAFAGPPRVMILLRQAYTSTFEHCNFSPAELVAGVLALSHRVTTGSWDAVADPASLNRVAAGLNLGAARFAEDYSPGSLTGAIGANNAPPSQG